MHRLRRWATEVAFSPPCGPCTSIRGGQHWPPFRPHVHSPQIWPHTRPHGGRIVKPHLIRIPCSSSLAAFRPQLVQASTTCMYPDPQWEALATASPTFEPCTSIRGATHQAPLNRHFSLVAHPWAMHINPRWAIIATCSPAFEPCVPIGGRH